jgi:hypothetical protein
MYDRHIMVERDGLYQYSISHQYMYRNKGAGHDAKTHKTDDGQTREHIPR